MKSLSWYSQRRLPSLDQLLLENFLVKSLIATLLHVAIYHMNCEWFGKLQVIVGEKSVSDLGLIIQIISYLESVCGFILLKYCVLEAEFIYFI